MIRRSAAPLLLLLLGGCAGAGAVPAELTQVPGVTATAPAQRFISLVGPKEPYAPPFLGVAGTNYDVLRSLLDRRTGEARHQLYVSNSYAGAERGWDAASDAQGQLLRVVPVSHHEISCENGCSYVEDFAADLPEALLRRHPQGFDVTFAARSGATLRLTVTGPQITAQLTAFDRGRTLLLGGTAAEAAPPGPSAGR